MSQDAVVAAAKKAGYSFGKSRLSQLETEEFPTWPGPKIIKGLSVALGIPERVLSLALLESMGLDIPQMPSSEWMLIVNKAEQMSPAEQRRLRRVVENLLDDEGENE